MLNGVRWILGGVVAMLVIAPPLIAYRYQYVHAKRFHEVVPGRFYRSGQMTADGFREIIERYHIKTVINLQHEEPDPLLANHWLGRGKVREKELCQQLGARYILITPDILPADNRLDVLPPAVDDFLKVLDDPSSYPILLHCKAGLHRTGRLTAIYRMEYEGWSPGEALRELRANGYGFIAASEADEFIIQFVENYIPRGRAAEACAACAIPAPGSRRGAEGRLRGAPAMMTTLDRMVLVAFFRSYTIVWSSLISLFVVIDLFTHLDAYMNRPGGFIAIASYIAHYYAYRIPQVFDLLAEPISLMAATFTVAWMQRNNELLPQLSAGIPTRRIIRPILLGGAITLTFAPLNQEFLIPEIADELMTARDDQEGSKAQILMGAFDTSGVHLEGQAGFRRDKRIEQFYATFPESSPSGMVHLSASEAIYIPPGDGPLTGGWMLTNTTPEAFTGPTPTNLTVLGTGRCFLKVASADFDTVSRGGTWYVFASTSRFREMLTGA